MGSLGDPASGHGANLSLEAFGRHRNALGQSLLGSPGPSFPAPSQGSQTGGGEKPSLCSGFCSFLFHLTPRHLSWKHVSLHSLSMLQWLLQSLINLFASLVALFG